MLACQERDDKHLLIKKLATSRMPQPVVVCLAREHPPALCTFTMAIQQGRGLVFMGLCPQRGITRHLPPRGVVVRVLWVRKWARQHVTDPLHTANKHCR